MKVIRARPAHESIALACSGGADSVTLVLALWANFPERRGYWRLAHFNHQLRGRASDEDEHYVAGLAEALGETCQAERWIFSEQGGHDVSEDAARKTRMEFFGRVMMAAGAKVIALGHQRDDVAETVLMRLSRGSGAGGLAAPRPVQEIKNGTIRIRPLLNLQAASIREILSKAGAHWREDASNESDVFLRNRVRHRVLPALKAASEADVLAGIAAAREQLEQDDAALEAWLEEILSAASKRAEGDFSALVGRPIALARRAVFYWLLTNGLGEVLKRTAVDKVIEAVASGGRARVAAGRGRDLAADGGKLTIRFRRPRTAAAAQRWPETRLEIGATVLNAAGHSVSAQIVSVDRDLLDDLEKGEIDPARTAYIALGNDWSGWLQIRGRKPGDRMRILGAPGTAKLKDLLINRKVPQELKDSLPVVISASGELIWVPGLPPAHEFAVQADSSTVVQLTYLRQKANVP